MEGRCIKQWLIVVPLIISITVSACADKRKGSDTTAAPKWLTEIVSGVDLEVVCGDKLPYINPYGSYGSPFIRGTIYTTDKVYNDAGSWYHETLKYIIVLCRKAKSKSNLNHSTDNLLNDFDYFLVFAESNKSNPRYKDEERGYKITTILEIGTPVGMHLLQGTLDMELSEFEFIDSDQKKGPKGINMAAWTQPVVIPYEKSRKLLAYYQGKWLVHNLEEW